MSTLTVNNSLLDYEGRTRSQLKNIRNYQRVS